MDGKHYASNTMLIHYADDDFELSAHEKLPVPLLESALMAVPEA